MAAYKIIFDKERCISCFACMVHCKVKNNVPDGINLNWLASYGPVQGPDGRPTFVNKYQPCEQCTEPKCVPVCPCDALHISATSNIVHLDQDACCGCGNCIAACPWQVPVKVPGTRKVMKCDYCADRVEEGLDPACVTGCTSKALKFVRM